MPDVRVPLAEFSEVPSSGLFSHFNLSPVTHRPGEAYRFCCILKHGDVATNTPPTLDETNTLDARCVAVELNLRLEDLEERHFEHSMGSVKTAPQLAKRLFDRYGAVRHMTMQEISGSLVAHTLFQMVARADLGTGRPVV